MKMPCSLCKCRTRQFDNVNEREYLQCVGCKAILLSPEYYLSPQAEKFRYMLHDNDVNNAGYITFVRPVIEKVQSEQKRDAVGLDFGCGPGPVITSELKKVGYQINLYDPYFKPDKNVLTTKYDFIICCEVMEHFQQPLKEFTLLRSLLKEEGKLYCKTEIWDPGINFDKWHYKNDQTHVIFYNRKTLEWIQKNLNFSKIEILDNFVVFTA